ncbi:helix-turn-helix domain-containing protein [Caldimonas thermodepolymerans]
MRKRAGAWLKSLREQAGLTQLEMATRLGYAYLTMISQIERGIGRVPPEDWPTWAELLRVDTREFARQMLYWYDPHAHYALFGGIHPHDAENLPRETSNVNRSFESGLAKTGRKPGRVSGD